MSFSMKRVKAIVMKDYKEFSRNYAVSIVVILPPLMAALFSRTGSDSIDSHFLLFNMVFAMVATYVQSCLIAEEREKNTLRGLLLSPASTADILIGKSALTFVLTAVVLMLTFFFSNYTPTNLPIILFSFVLSVIFYIALGTLIGLFTKSVMDASVYSLPVIGIFSLGSFITHLSDQYPILKLLHYLPNIQLIEIALKLENNAHVGNLLLELVIIMCWGIVTVLITVFFYKKRMID